MKKIFRLANAELSKVFMRPSMYILTLLLIVTLVFSFFLFKPSPITTDNGFNLESVSSIYVAFERKYEDGDYEKILIDEKTNIDTYLTSTANSYSNFTDSVGIIKDYFYGTFYNTIVNISTMTSTPSTSDLTSCKNAFKELKTKASGLMSYMASNIKNRDINFFFKMSDYEKIYNLLKNLCADIPSESDINKYETSHIINRLNLLLSKYDLRELDKEVNLYKQIEIDDTILSELLTKYYYTNIPADYNGTNHIGKLKVLYEAVKSYYLANSTANDDESKSQMNQLINNYVDYIHICKTLLSNNFELLRIGDKTDSEIAGYIGFSNFSVYTIKSELTASKYCYDNNVFTSQYLSSFNFNTQSGTEINAYDFTVYAMQILSAILTIFVIFYACNSINGELNNGTFKMLATRPYTRNKIFSGKFLFCFKIAIIFLLISLVASFAIGVASYGLTMQNVLVVLNASKVAIMNPLLLLLVYFVSLVIDIIFYIALAFVVSMIIKSQTLAVFISSMLFGGSFIVNGIVTSTWSKFLPSSHLGLFKFFTTSKNGFFSYSIIPDINMILSICIIVVSIVVFNLISRLVLTHKSLD